MVWWRGGRRAQLLLLALAAAGAAVGPLAVTAQTCGNIDARNRASGNGVTDDTAALLAMDNDPSVGLIYLPPGSYLVKSSLTLRKPVYGEKGSFFIVDSGANLTLQAQPEHPLGRMFMLRGSGRVVFGQDTLRSFPQWFGAVADGKTDDSAAIQAAFNAISVNGNAMLYIPAATYGLGSEVTLNSGSTVMAEAGARFVSVGGNPRGVSLARGGYAYKMVLPHFQGFSEFCLRLNGADLAALQLQTLSNCGDAIRLEATPGNDVNTCLDNTVWFETISNSRVGIAYRANRGCIGPTCVFQGNQIIGKGISGCAGSGLSSAIAFFSAPGETRPAWDSNQFNLGDITPCTKNKDYAMLYVNPGSETNREIIKVGSVGAVGPGASLFAGRHNVGQFSFNLRERQPPGAGNLIGLATLVDLTGQTIPPAEHAPIRMMTQSNSRASFNGGNSLLANFANLQAVPDTDWPAGESRRFLLYHQFATGELYHIKCDAPKLSSGLPMVSCTQAQDNSQAGSKVPEEVELWLINLTGSTVKAGSTGVIFRAAFATLSNP